MIATAVLGLSTRSRIIDGELVAAGASGQPDFRALLHGPTQGACVYCFDLMELRGRDIREQPLLQRRAQLEALLKRAGKPPRALQRGLPRRRRPACRVCAPWPRGDRLQATGLALSLGFALRLDKGQDRALARGQSGAMANV